MKIPTWLSSNAIGLGLFIVVIILITIGRLVWAHYVFDDLTCAFSTCVRVKP